jgi:hypothetical protein
MKALKKKPTKTPPKNTLVQTPGSQCRWCDKVIRQPFTSDKYNPYYSEMNKDMHASPYECIQHLKDEVKELKDDLDDIKTDVRRLMDDK